MPPRDGKSSASCCTSRTPPSPEGEPPRPAISPSKAQQQQTKEIISSGSTNATAVAELLPIFLGKGERETPSSQIEAGGLSKVENPLRGDRSDTEDEWDHIRSRKSTSTLNVVKQKIRKHLSPEFNLAKRRSISSVGTTEEEIERRAELRRLRHRRIKEELSNEASYDDDAKSIASITDGDTTLATAINTSWVPGDPIPVPHLLSSSQSYPVLPLRGLPSLEEQTDDDESCNESEDTSNTAPAIPPKSRNRKPRTVSRSLSSVTRRHSSPLLTKAEGSSASHETPQQPRKESLLPPIPSAPTLPPMRLPSIAEPPRSSWRLSFVSGKAGEDARRPSNEDQISTEMVTTRSTINGQPVLSRWLHGQGLRYSSNVIASLDEGNTTRFSLVSESRSCPVSNDIAGVDGGAEHQKTIAPLHEMGIHHRLFSAGTLHQSCSSPQLASWGSHHRGDSSMSNATDIIRKERGKFLRNTSNSAATSDDIPRSWGKFVHSKTSSFYSSTKNSSRPTPESSRFNLSSLLANSKVKPDMQNMSADDPAKNGTELTLATTSSDCSPQRLLVLSRQPRRPTPDDSSLLVSETESFREREAELSIVKARFASLESRRCPSTPVSSKFKEEFDLEPSIPESPIVRRPSKFSRLAKFAIRQHDGPAAGIDDTFGVPTTFAHSPSARKKSGAEEARGGAWGGTPRKKSKRPSKSADEVKTVLGGLAFMGNRRKKKKSTAGEENNGEDDDPKHMQELVMDSWEAEMAAIAGKAKAKSKNIVKKNKPTGPDLRYPSNWARFPSHTRHERSLSAGRPDKVQARDFGMKTVGNGEPTWYLHERKHHLYHYEGDDHSSHADDARKKGIFEKVHKILKEEIKNFENRGEPPEIEDTYGRRSSMNVPLETDFPELEILPMELRSAAQMEKEVLEQLAEQKRLQDLADTDMGTIDGSVDSGRAEVVGGISIADPKFYEDCVVTTTRQLSPDKIESRKGKFRTWAGKDFDTFKSLTSVSSGCGSGKRRRRELSLRKSTEDYHAELREMERVEREKVLSFAREVWGTRSDLRGKRDVIVSEVEVVDV